MTMYFCSPVGEATKLGYVRMPPAAPVFIAQERIIAPQT
jgi:hypothetical protein